MAAGSEILQEYLVSLGFRTDASSLHRFSENITSIRKSVTMVGTAIGGTIVALEASSAAFAYSMRKTYFASQLAGTSVKNLEAMEFAGKQFGISADSMGSALHNLAAHLRDPGMMALATSLTGINEAGRDTADVLKDLVRATSSMPEFIGRDFMAQFGVDPDTYHLMLQNINGISAAQGKMLDQFKEMGVDPDKAAKAALSYASTLDILQSKFHILTQALEIRFLPYFNALTGLLNNSIEFWTRWANGIGSVGTALDGLTAGKAWGFLKDLWGEVAHPMTSSAPAATTAKPAARSGVRSVRNNNPGNVVYGPWARAHGAVGEDRAGIKAGHPGFAIFPNMQSGFSAQEALLQGYGRSGLNTVQGIVSKYAPKNENATAAYIEAVSRRLGVSPTQALNLNDSTTLQRLTGEIAMQEGTPASYLTGGMRAGAVQVMQTNNFTITGTSPEGTALAVANVMNRPYSDLVRNLKGIGG